jgi:hypothetical protein
MVQTPRDFLLVVSGAGFAAPLVAGSGVLPCEPSLVFSTVAIGGIIGNERLIGCADDDVALCELIVCH